MEGSENNVVGHGKICKCPHHKVIPIMIILIGLDFLLGAIGTLQPPFVNVSWPILLIIIGGVRLGGCSCCARS
jgi:hypothetical protein